MKMKHPSRRNLLSLGAGLATLTACTSSKPQAPSLVGTPLSIGANDQMNEKTLPTVRLPNREGFVMRGPTLKRSVDVHVLHMQ
jgi:hypothetical protein